ncbi:unnamed protein product [Sphacelaria rigidula]
MQPPNKALVAHGVSLCSRSHTPLLTFCHGFKTIIDESLWNLPVASRISEAVMMKATHDRLLTGVEDVNMAEFGYPRGALELHQDSARVLYMIPGWLLSSGFTQGRRNAHDGHLFLPLLNTQRYVNKEDFDRRAPDNLRGLETKVVRRNEVYQGKSLLFVTADFFRLVQRWEAWYRHAFSKSYLLCTILGNLPE